MQVIRGPLGGFSLSKQLTSLILVISVACSTGMRAPLPSDAQCYSTGGMLWELGADATANAKAGSWLILLARSYSDSGGRRAAYAVDTYANTYEGSWQPLTSDSLEASLRDLFTTTQLRLVRRRDGLVGAAHGTSDELRQDSSGVFVPFAYDWVARFRRVACGAIPDSLLKYVQAR